MARENDDTTSRNATLLFKGRIDATSTVKCGPRSGYGRCKNIVNFAVCRAAGGGTPQVAVSYSHGPDGASQVTYGSTITATTIAAGDVVGGSTQADTNGHFGDVMECIVALTNSGWAVVEIYEVRKAF